ncbi:MAG: caspase family protein [Bacteroidetes bacterium]|nr:caspase family protein [Bacteroidota bacterium]
MAFFAFIFLFFLPAITQAQNPTLELQTGHSRKITCVRFNPAGDLLASASEDGLVILWDVQTGKQVRTLRQTSGPVAALDFHPHQPWLAVAGLSGHISLYDFGSNTPLQGIRLSAGLSDVHFRADGKEILACGNGVYRLSLAATGIEKWVDFHARTSCETAVYSPDQRQIAFSSPDKGTVEIYSTETGKTTAMLSEKVQQLAWDSSGTVLYGASLRGRMHAWRFTGSAFKSLYNLPANRLWHAFTAVSAASGLLAGGNKNGFVYLYHAYSGKLTQTLRGLNNQITTLAVHERRGLLATAGADREIILHSLKGEKISTLGGSGREITACRFGPGDNNLILGYANGELMTFHLQDFEGLHHAGLKPTLRDRVFHWQQRILRFDSVSADQTRIYGVCHKYRLYKRFKPGYRRQRALRFVWSTGPNTLKTLAKLPRVPVYNLYAGTQPGLSFFTDSNRSLQVYSGQERLFSLATGHTGAVTCADIGSGARCLITGSEDGFIHFYDTAAKFLCRLALFPGSNYLFADTSGYYMASRGASGYIGFSLRNRFFFLDQFDLQYNRPHEVLKGMPFYQAEKIAAFEQAFIRRQQRAAVSMADMQGNQEIPEIEIENRSNIPSTTRDPRITLRFRGAQQSSDSLYLQVSVNGVPLENTRGRKIPAGEWQSINLTLAPGQNLITARVRNPQGLESYRQYISIQYKPAEKNTPSLVFVPVSVSQYENEGYNLRYAAKDGRDLIRLFRQDMGKTRVQMPDTLLNLRALRENILSLRKQLLQTRPDDIVVLFFSGHGLLDDSFQFWFATHDMDFDQPAARGLSFEMIESLFEGIPARKRLVLLDACHSGEFDESLLTDSVLVSSSGQKITAIPGRKGGRVSYAGADNSQAGTFELMQQLFSGFNSESGLQVISAAAGNSYALESEDWQNGVFTYALLNGLKNGAADLDRNGDITIQELSAYVGKTVYALTNGQQRPTQRSENILFNWKLK